MPCDTLAGLLPDGQLRAIAALHTEAPFDSSRRFAGGRCAKGAAPSGDKLRHARDGQVVCGAAAGAEAGAGAGAGTGNAQPDGPRGDFLVHADGERESAHAGVPRLAMRRGGVRDAGAVEVREEVDIVREELVAEVGR